MKTIKIKGDSSDMKNIALAVDRLSDTDGFNRLTLKLNGQKIKFVKEESKNIFEKLDKGDGETNDAKGTYKRGAKC